MKCVSYKNGYKYQITREYKVNIDILPEQDIDTKYIALSKAGELTIKDGYAWDGPSGPTIDTLNFMRGSLVHDALYQLMRNGLLENGTYRDKADRLLQKMCQEDGMTALRAWWVYQGVRFGGKEAASEDNKKPITHAPVMCEMT